MVDGNEEELVPDADLDAQLRRMWPGTRRKLMWRLGPEPRPCSYNWVPRARFRPRFRATLDGILSGKLPTYRVVHLIKAGLLAEAGFEQLPTFGRPHMTLLLGSVDRVESL